MLSEKFSIFSHSCCNLTLALKNSVAVVNVASSFALLSSFTELEGTILYEQWNGTMCDICWLLKAVSIDKYIFFQTICYFFCYLFILYLTYRILRRASCCTPRTFHVIVGWSPSSISRWDGCQQSATKTCLSSCLNIRRYSSTITAEVCLCWSPHVCHVYAWFPYKCSCLFLSCPCNCLVEQTASYYCSSSKLDTFLKKHYWKLIYPMLVWASRNFTVYVFYFTLCFIFCILFCIVILCAGHA